MNKIGFIILNLLIIGCQSKTNQNPNFNKALLGKYGLEITMNQNETLELFENGNFLLEVSVSFCVGGGETRRFRGDYNISNDTLQLEPKQLIEIWYHDDKISKLDSTKYYESEETYFKKQYQIFKWLNKIYLFSEDKYANWGYKIDINDYEDFISEYNSGYEPKLSGHYLIKEVDEKLTDKEIDTLIFPLKYRKMFLNAPIDCKVLEIGERIIKENDKEEIRKNFTIDKGKNDGVYENLYFYGYQCCDVKILDVKDEISYGISLFCNDEMNNCKIGDKLSTASKEREYE